MNLFVFFLVLFVAIYFFALIFYKNYKFKNFYSFQKSLNYDPKNFQTIAYVFLFLSLLILIFAVFFTDYKNTDNKNTSNQEVVFLLDVSKSMKALDYKNNGVSVSRLDAAKNLIKDFVLKYQNFSYGLSVFAGEVVGITPIMNDLDTYLTFLYGVDENNVLKQGTDINNSILYRIDRFGKNDVNSRKILVLISDGGDEIDKRFLNQISQKLSKENIEFYIVGVGTKGGAYIPDKTDVITGEIIYKTYNSKKVLTKLNEENLKNIARNTNSKYIRLEKYGDLDLLNIISGNKYYKNISLTKNIYFIIISFCCFILYISLLFLPKILGKK